MHWFPVILGLLVAIAAIPNGVIYIISPMEAARNFGLPMPGQGEHVASWLRLKGLRDLVAGLMIIALFVWSDRHSAGVALVSAALIPIGDMSLILAARGSTRRAFGMHGLTAVLMVLAGALLIEGGA